MKEVFKENTTNAQFILGDFGLIKSHSTAKQIGFYTFIWTQKKPITLNIDGIDKTLEPRSILALTPNQYLKVNDFVEDLIVYQFNRYF